jgi:ABC-type antimicrobial peptide transport system permease subunit
VAFKIVANSVPSRVASATWVIPGPFATLCIPPLAWRFFYSVLQRRREIGIRMAIGSTRAGIVRIVTLDVFLMIALGGCAGVALGFGATRYVESLFYQVKATDADMIALPACAILLTALVATLPAVLRALRTDPTEILRAE